MDIFSKFYLGLIRSAQIRIAMFLYKIVVNPQSASPDGVLKDLFLGQTEYVQCCQSSKTLPFHLGYINEQLVVQPGISYGNFRRPIIEEKSWKNGGKWPKIFKRLPKIQKNQGKFSIFSQKLEKKSLVDTPLLGRTRLISIASKPI